MDINEFTISIGNQQPRPKEALVKSNEGFHQCIFPKGRGIKPSARIKIAGRCISLRYYELMVTPTLEG
jgi:hypothetical protein